MQSSTRKHRAVGFCLGWLASLAIAGPALAGSDAVFVGWQDLLDRIGLAELPTGAGVVVAQVEAAAGAGGTNYGPDQSHSEFQGKSFIAQSGPPGASGHATTVGRDYYGLSSSVAPDISTIHLYHANGFLLGNFLRTSGDPFDSTPPLPLPDPNIRIFNHSWIGSFSNPDLPGYDPTPDNNALRRADFAIVRDNTLMVAGVNNDELGDPSDGANRPLMSHLFNGVAVGVRDGTHTTAGTIAGIDGPGRMKPEVVAPGGATSFAAPVVSAVGAMLIETARTHPETSTNPDAQRVEVLKSVLFAGANPESAHGTPWTNNPATSGPLRGVTSTPLDMVTGAGTVDVNISHLILTSGEQNGSTTVPLADTMGFSGWALEAVSTTPSTARNRYWRFTLDRPVEELTFVTTWHRQITSPFFATAAAGFDLTLRGAGEGGSLISLVGDAGLGVFDAGNVVSQSAVDNVEMLRVFGLQSGAYILHLRRTDSLSQQNWPVAVAWFIDGTPPGLDADLNGDGVVNGFDLGILLASWSIPPTAPGCGGTIPCAADLNGDGVVNGFDLGILLGSWTL